MINKFIVNDVHCRALSTPPIAPSVSFTSTTLSQCSNTSARHIHEADVVTLSIVSYAARACDIAANCGHTWRTDTTCQRSLSARCAASSLDTSEIWLCMRGHVWRSSFVARDSFNLQALNHFRSTLELVMSSFPFRIFKYISCSVSWFG